MQQKIDIVPWVCHVCEKPFNTAAGGICKVCNKPTCAFCFGQGTLRKITSIKKPELQICPKCAKAK